MSKKKLSELRVEEAHPPVAPPKIEIIEKETLHPPEIPKVEEQDFFIDWTFLVNNSSFQRGFQEFLTHSFPFLKGISVRKSKVEVDKSFREKTIQVNEAMKLSHEIKSLPKELLTELKEKLGKDNYGLIHI